MNDKNKKANPLSRDILEDAPETVAKERSFNHWIDEIYADFEKHGGNKDLPGFGKPLKLTEGDPIQSILKNANYLPPWLELQKEIGASIEALIKQMQSKNTNDLECNFTEINQKIRKYNKQVPLYFMQKMMVTPENIVEQFQKWL